MMLTCELKKDNLYRENILLGSFLILMAALFTASYMFRKSHVYILHTIKSIFAISNERQMLVCLELHVKFSMLFEHQLCHKQEAK